MKIRPLILWICIACVMMIAVLVWRSSLKPAPLTYPVAGANSVGRSNAAPVSPKGDTLAPIVNNQAAVTNIPLTNIAAPPWKNPREQIKELLATKNDVPIIFYGKLEDQFSNPVVGAEVVGSTIINRGEGIKGKRFVTTSAANGNFTLDAERGESIGIMPKKEGYALATTRTSFEYSHMRPDYFVPDANSPVVIKMWKLQGAEPLIHFHIDTYILRDGAPVSFDFQAGRCVDFGGDIVISVESPSKPIVGQPYDWKAIVRVPEGGIILSSNDFDQMFQAPDSGYKSEIVFAYEKDAIPWVNGFNHVFYFTSRGSKKYGRVAIEVSTDMVKDGAIPITLTGFINPTGSPNLEVDPKLVTEARP